MVDSITMSEAIRVMLAEDHTIVREGLRALLGGSPELEVVGEAADGLTAVEMALRLRPHVVVMDLGMPKKNGVDATREIKEQAAEISVLVLSMYAGEEYVRSAVRAGANGYLLKGSGLSDLVAAICALARGDAFFSPEVAKILLPGSPSSPRKGSVKIPGIPALTKREKEVVTLVAEGKSSAEIATLLGLSVKTIEGHRGRIMAKLGAHNVAGLVRHAIRLGLVSAEMD